MPTQNNPIGNPGSKAQSFIAFPRSDAPLADVQTGQIELPWYQFLVRIFQALGGGTNSVPAAAFMQQQVDGSMAVLDANSGVVLGFLKIYPSPPP